MTIWNHGSKGGIPYFIDGLRGHTDIGPRWYSVIPKLQGKLPAGYSWDWYPEAGTSGTLTFDSERAKKEGA